MQTQHVPVMMTEVLAYLNRDRVVATSMAR